MTPHRVALSISLAAALALVQPGLAEDAAQAPLDSTVAAAASEEAPAAQPNEPAADAALATPPAPALSAADYVLAERPEALRGISRVAITTFSVEYMTFLEAKTEGDWGNLIANKPNNVSVKMTGHDPAGWQAVVDSFYEKLVADLTAAGIEVVPQETLRAQPDYATIAKAALQLPKEIAGRAGKGTYYSAGGLPAVIQDEVTVFRQGFKLKGGLFGGKPPEDLYTGAGTKLASAFSNGRVMPAERAIAKKLDAHVLKVRLTVLPTQVSADHSFWVGGHVETNAAVSLVPFVNRYLFYAPNGKEARLSIKQDLVSTRPTGQLKDVTSVGSKAAQVAGVGLRVAGALYGLSTPGAIGKAKDYEFAVDNTTYPSVVGETLTTAHELFMQQLIAARDASADD
jgi:hypothetical protein